MSHTAHYHTFGCKLNFAETSTIAEALEASGVVRAADGDTPDIVVVNTCAVTAMAQKKCQQLIRAYSRRWPQALIAVTGCYAQLQPVEVSALPGVAIVWGNDNKTAMVSEVLRHIRSADAGSRAAVSHVTKAKDIRSFTPSCSRGDRTRYFLKVQDGCDYFCSYCTIPYARGRSRSGNIDDIVAQARQAAANGGKEIVITGVNIGDYGHGTDITFLDLLRRLDDVEGIQRYRISSIEPNLLTDEIIEWVARSRAFMPHFHIPLQSGSNKVLEMMRRRYDTSLFAHKIHCIRQIIPDAFIGVDLIVGAKGETPQEFEISRQMVESLDITRLHIFPYSERPGTRAVAENEWYRVDQAEKHRRANIMQEISDRKLKAFVHKNCGTRRKVLVEHTAHGNYMYGLTDNYLRVKLPLSPTLYNQLVDVQLTEPVTDGTADIIASL